MAQDRLDIRIENANRTDFRELRRSFGEPAVTEIATAGDDRKTPVFGEPVSIIIGVALAKVAAGAFVAWVVKQRELRRTILKLTITTPDGTKVEIDLADPRISGGSDNKALLTELAKAGVTIAAGEHHQ